MTRAGFVGLAGRPNVGKSTLVNALVGSHVAIVSVRPQTTRRAIRGVATDLEAERQLVLVDLPGVQRPRDALTRRMQHRVERELADSDVALLVVNGEEGVGPGDRFIARALIAAGPKIPVLCAVNKCDRLGPGATVQALSAAAELDGVDEVFPISARGGEGLDALVGRLGELVPEGPYMYPPQDHSDQSSELLLAELIREQVLNRTRQEIPHSVEVSVVKEVDARGRPGHGEGRDLGRDRVPEADPDRQGGREDRRGRHRRAALAGARAGRPRPPRPHRPRAPQLAPRRGPAGPARDRINGRSLRFGPMFGEIEFDQRGLAPCVVQDFASGEVLMLAYISSQSLEMTLETGDLHFHSRSRDELWRKGESSGSFMHLRQLRYDCDGDALVAMVDPAGPACHTGQRSCFYREVLGSASSRKDAPPAPGEPFPVNYEALPALERTLRSRAVERPDGSYTVKLLDDDRLIGEKVEEEAEEVVRAAREESNQRVAEEAADVLYHLSVLLASRGIPQSAVMEVLNARSG